MGLHVPCSLSLFCLFCWLPCGCFLAPSPFSEQMSYLSSSCSFSMKQDIAESDTVQNRKRSKQKLVRRGLLSPLPLASCQDLFQWKGKSRRHGVLMRHWEQTSKPSWSVSGTAPLPSPSRCFLCIALLNVACFRVASSSSSRASWPCKQDRGHGSCKPE